MTITLTPELESALARRAARQGTTPELLALHDLHALYREEGQAAEAQANPSTGDQSTGDQFVGKSLADVLAGRTGTIHSSEYTGVQTSHLSEEEGEGFAAYLAEKRQQGRL